VSQQQKYNKSDFFSGRLRQLRGSKSQEDFARELGLKSQQTYRNYEAGRVPKVAVLQRIAQHCGVTVEWLVGPERAKDSPVREYGPRTETEREILRIIQGGPALAAKKMDEAELLTRIKEHTEQLQTGPDYMRGAHAEIIAALSLELNDRSRPKDKK
jgi:transcriptional regulator with XRE-family HTH domain